MVKQTHRAFAFAVSTAALAAVHEWLPVTEQPFMVTASQILLGQAAAVGVSTLPDIDQAFGEHRGITHSIWPVLGLGYLAYTQKASPFLAAILFGIVLGYFSHILGDAFSTAGIAWFYPLQGYTHYSGGAFVVKGFRGPFVPIYKVGDRAFSFMPMVWWILGIGLSVLLWGRML